MRKILGTILAVCICTVAGAQQVPKELPAQRTTQPVKIDGLLNDAAWKDAATMTNLVEFRPRVGDLEDPANRTVTYLMYNDEGIYFGGYCYDRDRRRQTQ